MTYIAFPTSQAQEKAIKAFFEALEVPYKIAADQDETSYLLSTSANKERLEQAMQDDKEGKGVTVTLDDTWK